MQAIHLPGYEGHAGYSTRVVWEVLLGIYTRVVWEVLPGIYTRVGMVVPSLPWYMPP